MRRGQRAPGYTAQEMADRIGIDRSWIYREIGRGRIDIVKDEYYGCYLFPRTRAAVRDMKRLKLGEVPHVSFRKEHCNG